MSEDLSDFFKLIAQEKKQKKEEFSALVGDLNLGDIFSEVSNLKKEDKKKKKEEQKKKKEEKKKELKALKAFENFIYGKEITEIKEVQEAVEEWIEEVVEEPEEELIQEVTEVIEEPEEELIQEVIEEPEEELIQEVITAPLPEEKEELVEEPEEENTDSLTPLTQDFVTQKELQEHYKLFINRVQQQLSSLGGGGETRLEFLDDVDRNSAKVNGRFLKYDAASGKWIGALGGGGGSQTLDDTLGLGNTSSLGMSVGVITATSFVKSGGTSSQFLKADGSIDTTTYATQTYVGVATAGLLSSNGSGSNLTGIVTSITAGSGISINQSTGNVTITATGGGVVGYATEGYVDAAVAGVSTFSGDYNDLTNQPTIPDTSGFAAVTGATFTGNVDLNNTVYLRLGNDRDNIIGYTGAINLLRFTDNTRISGDTMFFTTYNGVEYMRLSTTFGTQLKHQGITRLTVDSTGININGQLNDLTIPSGTGTIAITADIPTNNNELTNGRGYITSSSLVGYATEDYVDSAVAGVSTFSGDYNDLSNKPTIPSIVGLASEGYVDAAVSGVSTFSGDYNDLTNTPTIPSDTGDLTNSVGFVTSSIVVGYATEGYVDTQVGLATAGLASETYVDNLVDISTFSGDYNDLTNQPTIPVNLTDLSDVNAGSPSMGQVLKWSGSEWTAAADLTGEGGVGIGLSDLSVTTSAAGISSLTYNDVTGVFQFTPASFVGYATEGYVDTQVGLATVGLASGEFVGLATAGLASEIYVGLSTVGLASEEFVGLATVGLASVDYVDTQVGLATAGLASEGYVNNLVAISTFSGDYNDLTNQPTIPSDTGDLTNSIGFVTSSVVVGYATEGYVDTQFLRSDVADTKSGITTFSDDVILQSNLNVTGVSTFGGNLDVDSNNILNVDTLRINQTGTGLRMTNVGAFDNDGSNNFRVYATNNLQLKANGDSGGGLSIDATNNDVTIDNDLRVSAGQFYYGGTAVTATSTELNYLDGVTGITLGTANELLIVGSDGSSIESDGTLNIDPGNNYVGINQASPEVTLHMTGEGAQTAQIRMEQYNDNADAPDLRSRRYRGTSASPSAVQAGDYLYRSNHEYYNGTSLLVGGAFAFDNTNNANRTQFSVAVDTDGTGANPAGNNGQFKIDGNDNGAITFNNAYKFPTSDGSANQVLQTNGSGTLSFSDLQIPGPYADDSAAGTAGVAVGSPYYRSTGQVYVRLS
jgi:hypothetical protein